MLSAAWAWLTSKAAMVVGALVGIGGLVAAIFLAGKRDQAEADRVNDLEDFIATKKEIDDVEASPDRDTAVERLRDNGWVR